MAKFAIILQAGPNEPARAWHALLYGEELQEAGHEVRILFDGAGTTWVKAFADPGHMHHDEFERLLGSGAIAGACSYCSAAFAVRDDVAAAHVPLHDERDGHPRIAPLVADGFTLLVL